MGGGPSGSLGDLPLPPQALDQSLDAMQPLLQPQAFSTQVPVDEFELLVSSFVQPIGEVPGGVEPEHGLPQPRN